MKYFRDRKLSAKADELVQFDADSIRQVAKAKESPAPDIWLADPDGYERDGRIHRDNDSHRMLAYSRKSQTLYATDGCNSCARNVRLDELTEDRLQSFARENELPVDLLERLVALL
jgi:hypothetical protein